MTINRDAAGVSANGNDVANLISYGPFNIQAHDSIILSFALLASNSLFNLEISALESQLLYDSLYISVPNNQITVESFQISPNPSSDFVQIEYNSIVADKIRVEIYRLDGTKVFNSGQIPILSGKNRFSLSTGLNEGYYIVKLINGKACNPEPLIIR
jgi:hypothetical protein